jgi:bacillolysin
MRRALVLIAVLTGLVAVGTAAAGTPREAAALDRLAEASRAPLALYRNPTTSAPYFLTGRIPASSFSRSTTAAGRGADFWAAYGGLFGVRDVNSELALRREETDVYGVRHLRYAQRYRGLVVHGQELLVHLRRGEVIAVNGRFAGGLELSTTAAVSDAGAAWVASGAVSSRGRRHSVGAPTLLVHVDGLGRARLAWLARVATGNPLGVWRVFIDAHSGDVLQAYNDLQTARDRQTYTNANDADCNNWPPAGCTLPGALVRNEAAAPSGDPVVDDAHAHTATVYGYYSTRHGRDSYDGAGHPMRSTVHFGSNYNNAFWCNDDCAVAFGSLVDGEQMAYGDGNGGVFSPLGRDLDVVGHELTHAVTDSEAALEYFGQSGALNESNSDVFAAFMSPDTNGGEWLIGENSFTPGTPGDALRDMANPAAGGQPAHMSEYVNTWYDNSGVHINSGIPNHAAYLAATHPTYGIGRDALEDIYYYALTGCLNTQSDFLENLQCLELGAQVVFPGDAAKAQAIRSSQADVGIAAIPAVVSPGGGESLPQGVATDVTWQGGMPTGHPFGVQFLQSSPTTYNQGFESGPPLPPDFTTSGDAPWFVTTQSAGGGVRSARSGDIGDNGRSELHLTVHLRAASPVTFKRFTSTESGYDFLSFHVDGIPLLGSSGLGSWGTPVFFPLTIPAGAHEFVWIYEKDYIDSAGLDAAFIDDLQIPNLESATATVINGSTAADATSQSWTPPNAAGANYRIRVQRLGIAPWLAFDESNGTFTVGAAPQPPAPQPPAPQPPAPQPPAPQPPAPQPPAPQPPAPQPPPPPPVRCVVPNIKGKTVPAARQLLAARRCALGTITRKFSPRVKKGRILSQSRAPGARLPRGTRVNVGVSRGRRR